MVVRGPGLNCRRCSSVMGMPLKPRSTRRSRSNWAAVRPCRACNTVGAEIRSARRTLLFLVSHKTWHAYNHEIQIYETNHRGFSGILYSLSYQGAIIQFFLTDKLSMFDLFTLINTVALGQHWTKTGDKGFRLKVHLS